MSLRGKKKSSRLLSSSRRFIVAVGQRLNVSAEPTRELRGRVDNGRAQKVRTPTSTLRLALLGVCVAVSSPSLANKPKVDCDVVGKVSVERDSVDLGVLDMFQPFLLVNRELLLKCPCVEGASLGGSSSIAELAGGWEQAAQLGGAGDVSFIGGGWDLLSRLLGLSDEAALSGGADLDALLQGAGDLSQFAGAYGDDALLGGAADAELLGGGADSAQLAGAEDASDVSGGADGSMISGGGADNASVGGGEDQSLIAGGADPGPQLGSASFGFACAVHKGGQSRVSNPRGLDYEVIEDGLILEY